MNKEISNKLLCRWNEYQTEHYYLYTYHLYTYHINRVVDIQFLTSS